MTCIGKIVSVCGAFIALLSVLPTVVAAQSIGVDLGAVDVSIGGGRPASVPEIDASTGAMALAALAAALVLAWEVNRRRKAG
ncbi:VPEID-CTERM sorting domain-containing protein [Leisingera sp.]|uniref:VPEID-CTERM sorting domain-containing protein n=1 Tax=Leisingera sp. TaxID=1879318 RepID=UPI002B27507B|nr:VPEID-CTERM sorting domain-containing protein [Leisingera sp.]